MTNARQPGNASTLVLQRYPHVGGDGGPTRLHPRRIDHFDTTVRAPVPISWVQPYVEDDVYRAIADASIRDRATWPGGHLERATPVAPMWGFHNTPSIRKKFDNLRARDIVMFFDKSGIIWAAARIAVPFISLRAAKEIVAQGRWETYEGAHFPLLLTFGSTRTNIRIPIEQIGEIVKDLGDNRRSPIFLPLSQQESKSVEALLLNRSTNNTSSGLPTAAIPPAPPGTKPRHCRTALVIATEWHSRNGGIPTFNRGLCIALAQQGLDVECLVGPDEVAEVGTVVRQSGLPEPGRIHLTRVPIDRDIIDKQTALGVALKSAGAQVLRQVDIVIGHGHITGTAARMIAKERYPAAALVHIVHTDPERVAAFKAGIRSESEVARGAEKATIERLNCAAADVVCGVGPKLVKTAQYLLNATAARDRRVKNVRESVVQLLPGPIDETLNEPPPVPHVLAMGRLDDLTKGMDLFSAAIEIANRNFDQDLLCVVRGIGEETADREQRRLLKVSRNARVRAYTSDTEALEADMRNAAVVCMASREEGFGLVAFEATMRGIPVLVPDDSGLGLLLLDRRRFDPAVVSQANDDEKIAAAWSEAMTKVLKNQDAAYEEARDRKARLIQTRPSAPGCDWATTARILIEAISKVPAA